MLARELGERIGMPVINSDTLRKAIAGKLGRQAVPFNDGIYSANMTEKTYAKIKRDGKTDSGKQERYSRCDLWAKKASRNNRPSGGEAQSSSPAHSLFGF